MTIKNVVLALVLLALFTASLGVAQQNGGDGDPATIPDLMKEREAVLEKLVAFAKAEYQQGIGSLDAVVAAQKELLNARLEAATTPSERIAIRKAQLEIATSQEKEAEKLVAAGAVSAKDLMRAKANRLTAQIQLQREQRAASE